MSCIKEAHTFVIFVYMICLDGLLWDRERGGKCCVSLFSLANNATLDENNIQIKCSVSLYKYVFALMLTKDCWDFL